ncbi:uromodulin-like 1 [Corythoichthys intestinalis]|uniref:uromodulin-like 1 n=1 Tax=Corythoichthys intestinalis TaxID=161448 RepID=UPI0025A5DDAC|nr:uromodulin-like 1 [Corythoichthys intestinalis]
MGWNCSVWVVFTFLVLYSRKTATYEGNSLSASGYHLCIYNETRNLSSLVLRRVPYTVSKSCGGWLFWMVCPVTLYRIVHQTEHTMLEEQVTRCCHGYVPIGSYCALSLNYSEEFLTKPGSCPTTNGSYSDVDDCDWDIDCPVQQKCCERSGHLFCTNPERSANYTQNGRSRFNATVTVKTDYEQLMNNGALLNHTRLLQAMVTGALQFVNFSVYYLASWPVHPYRTATSLLIDCSLSLSLHNITSKLHFLLKHIPEVSAVTVGDVNECAHPTLHQCSPLAQCSNTVGSYQCECRGGYLDVDPSNPGTHCADTNNITIQATTEVPPCSTSLMNITSLRTADNETVVSYPVTANNVSTPSLNTSAVFQTTTDVLTLTLCTFPASPGISRLQSANITGTSFCVYWSSLIPANQTYLVVLSEGSEVISKWTTEQTMLELKNLQPGVLYNVTVKLHTNESHYIAIKTDAQTLDATTRLTNIPFTEDLHNTSSQAYKNLTASILDEIYRSLTQEIKAMVNSGQVRIEIRHLSPGSVVVNFTVIFSPDQEQDIRNTSSALLYSLMNSSIYVMDENNTIISDFDECVPLENDCSQWAECTNTWGSYTCSCLDGFLDTEPQRPGRACQAIMETTALLSTVSTFPLSRLITSTYPPNGPTTMTMVPTTRPNLPTTITTVPTTTSNVQTTITMVPTITSNALTTLTMVPTTTPIPATTSTTVSTTITRVTTDTTSAPPTTPNGPTTMTMVPTTRPNLATTFTTVPTTTPNVQTTITMVPTITSNAPTTLTMLPKTNPTTSSILTTTVITVPTAVTVTPKDANNTPTTTPSGPTTITMVSTAATTSTAVLTTVTTEPTSNPIASTTHVIQTTTRPTNELTTENIDLASNDTSNRMYSILGDISVDCTVTGITVTVAREFLVNHNIKETTLYLGHDKCGVTRFNASHAQLIVEWNECGIIFAQNESYYTASVTLFSNMETYLSPSGTLETPKLRLEVPIICTYMRSMLMSADFGSMGYELIQDVITSSGMFQVTVQLLNGTFPLPYNYSLSPEEAVVVEVSMNTSAEEIKVVIYSCWATPTQNPFDDKRFVFLDNRCALNMYTVVLMNGNSSTSRVSVQIFSFVDVNLIYLHCHVQICMQIGSDTCVPDCMQRTSSSSNIIGRMFGSTGPLIMSEEGSPESEYDKIQMIGLCILGVVIVLFFVIGSACLFYYQRNRIGHYNFNANSQSLHITDINLNA